MAETENILPQVHRPRFDAVRSREGTEPFLHLCWMLHNQCNHRCSYCSEVNWGGSFRWLTLGHATRFVDRALSHYEGRKPMVSFTGGEPTLWPDFGPFVEWLNERGILIGMTTNGTKPLEFFERYSRRFGWISFSFHPEFTKPEKFLGNVAEASKHSLVAIRVMMPSDFKLWEKSTAFIALAKQWNQEGKFSSQLNCELVPIVLGFGSAFTRPSDYSQVQNDVLRQSAILFGETAEKKSILAVDDANLLNLIESSQISSPDRTTPFDTAKLIAENSTDFRGWTCDIGLEQLFIDERGDVLRAGCRVGGKVGHISDVDLKFPTKTVRCVKPYCHCITDILTSKRSPEWEQLKNQDSSGLVDTLVYHYDLIRHHTASNRRHWRTSGIDVTANLLRRSLKAGESVLPAPQESTFRSQFYFGAMGILSALHLFSSQAFWNLLQVIPRPVKAPYHFLRKRIVQARRV